MQTEKINQIITRKNEELERHACQTAEQLINEIVGITEDIQTAQRRIEECRAELKALEIQTINAKTVLGE